MDMKIVDAHFHIGEWTHPKLYAELKSEIKDVKELGLDGAVLIPTNKAEKIKNPERDNYFVFGWCNNDNYDELKYNIEDYDGFKIHASLEGRPLAIHSKVNISWVKFLDLSAKYEKTVLIHCGRHKYSSFDSAVRVAKKYDNVNFIFAHMGGNDQNIQYNAPTVILENELSNVSLDVVMVRNYWLIERAVEILGSERLIFGSDYPIMMPYVQIAVIESCKLYTKEREDIYSKNILRLLGGE